MSEATNQPTNRAGEATSSPVVGGTTANRLGGAFYAVVAAVALAGQTNAAVGWLHWPVLVALPAVAALELGGITLAARSDYRRRLGERAYAARLLSGAVAVFAVAFNWLGHGDHLAGGFFAGMSGLGYCVWLIQAGDRRRDQLRARGDLPSPPPAYPLPMWLRHPLITRRARELAKADPGLGLYGSLAAARAALRTERREAAIAQVLRRKIRASTDRTTAEIAVTVFDLDEIARRLAASADYDGLTVLVATDLDPARLLADQPEVPARKATKPKPTIDRATDRGSELARPEPTDRPRRSVSTDRPAADRSRLQVVGEPAAVANARHLRGIYGNQLPTTERAIRSKTGWSKVRVEKAVEAYLAGADNQPDDPGESPPLNRDRTPAMAGVG